jgi:hypothetical protein
MDVIQKNNLSLIKEIVIPNPPTYFNIKKKRKSAEAGQDIYDKYYLTSNLFFNNNTSFFIISKIVKDCKLFLLPHLKGLPEMDKLFLEIEVNRTKHIDLDNVSYFWKKLLLDILKTPTKRQIDNSTKKKRDIITTNTIQDDSTKIVIGFKDFFNIGESRLIFRIFGRVKSEQKELDLFFK